MPSPGRPVGRAQLSGLHLRIFALHMKGATNKQIALELGCSEQTVSNVLNTDFFKQAKQDVVENTIRNLAAGTENAASNFSPMAIAKAVAPRMMQIAIAIAESPTVPPATRLRATDTVLDRVLGKATQRVVVDALDSILERCSDSEIETYIKTNQLPEWASNVGGTVH
jgi:orotate phosphoribosyltransferase-like protein